MNKEKKEDKRDTKQATTKRTRCFECGSVDHEVKECPHKDKGPNCFKCNQFGHVSVKCGNTEKVDKKRRNSKPYNE